MKKKKAEPSVIVSSVPDSKNLVGLWGNLSRMYEVAKLGGFSLRVVYLKEYLEGNDDYNQIKSFYSDVKFSSEGDLVCEITKPYSYVQKRAFETLSNINDRVVKAASNVRPTAYQSDSCEALIKVVSTRLNLSLTDVEKIHAISSVIAQLDGSDTIKCEHCAEAIMYLAKCNVDDMNCVEAENNVMNFGGNIKINVTEINTEHVEAAIEYLKTLL